MEELPAEFPPEYVSASNAGRIVGVVGTFHFIALTFVALRLYVRLFMVRAFGVDDALIIGAVVSSFPSRDVCLFLLFYSKCWILTSKFRQLLALGSWICLVLQIPYGLGRHGPTISVDDRTHFEHISFWKTVLSDGFALGLLRISMAITLLRLARDRNWYRWSLYAVIGMGSPVPGLVSTVSVGLQATPSYRLRHRVLYPSHRLAIRLLHPVLGMVGVPMDEPVRSQVP